jgi:hypothetical protein
VDDELPRAKTVCCSMHGQLWMDACKRTVPKGMSDMQQPTCVLRVRPEIKKTTPIVTSWTMWTLPSTCARGRVWANAHPLGKQSSFNDV